MPRVSPLRAFGAHRTQHPFEGKVNTRRRRKLKDVARTLPRAPGVYFFYGFNERLLYIGKANCLRERVRSYFGETKVPRPPKLRRLLAEIERLDFEECGSELEALLLERRLIAERKPILNWQHKRYEIYPYLLLSDEAFPRLTVTRAEPVSGNDEGRMMNDERGDLENSSFNIHHSSLPLETPPHPGELPGLYLGPFTTPRAAYWTFEAVRSVFSLRSCEGELKPDPNGNACIYHEIGRCCGPCIGAVSQQEYSSLCDDLIRLLRTGNAAQLEQLKTRMERLANEWRFEEAAKLKEQLAAIELVAARLQRLERMRACNNVAIVQLAKRSAIEQTQYNVFLVQGGVVRRHLSVTDWDDEGQTVKRIIREVYSSVLPAPDYTAKAELDEMMILDRWLQAHGNELCCAWMNDRASRQWAASAVRRLHAWSRRNI